MYDPAISRFVSPDSIVPGAALGIGGSGGTVGAWQNSILTVDFHESAFVSTSNADNMIVLGSGFAFQRETSASPPKYPNPQSLARFAYVLNNPLRYVDPTGHCYDYCGAAGERKPGNGGSTSSSWEGCAGAQLPGYCMPYIPGNDHLCCGPRIGGGPGVGIMEGGTGGLPGNGGKGYKGLSEHAKLRIGSRFKGNEKMIETIVSEPSRTAVQTELGNEARVFVRNTGRSRADVVIVNMYTGEVITVMNNKTTGEITALAKSHGWVFDP